MQAERLVAFMPDRINTYYEPFCGGCSVFNELVNTPGKKVGRYILSDMNADVIGFYNRVKDDLDGLVDGYAALHGRLNSFGDPEERKSYWYTLRDRFNAMHDTVLFALLTRTSFNGLIRYNGKGEFNAPFHFTRPGISPDSLYKILDAFRKSVTDNDVTFLNRDYAEAVPQNVRDFVYMDPPYPNMHGSLYLGGIDCDRLFAYIHGLGCPWQLSFDGKTGLDDRTYPVPEDLYKRHIYIRSGKSSFRRLVTGECDRELDMVADSLYMNY